MTVWLRSIEIRSDEFPHRDCYPFDIPALRRRQTLELSDPVAFLVGENGSGKSTLVEAVARRCGLHIWAEPKRRVSSSRARDVKDGTPPVRQHTFADYLTVELTNGPVRGGVFSAETFRDWAEFVDDLGTVDPGQLRYFGGDFLTTRSHGEGLLSYFRARYRIPGLYLMDEPEAALSPRSQLELARLLAEFRRGGEAQFLIATHSPILLALPGAQVFVFDADGVRETPYTETESFRLYKGFLEDPGAFLGR